MLRLKRFITKIISKLSLSPKKIVPGVYFIEQSTSIKKVLFYLNDPQRFHLGDHFFIEPLTRLMRDNNLQVDVMPLTQMDFYFEWLGLTVPKHFEPSHYDLIISRIEFYPLLRNFSKSLLILDTTDNKINQPICNYFLEHVSALLHLNLEATQAKPSVPYFAEQSNFIESSKKYLVFNNYLASSQFLITKRHLNLLSETARKIAHEQNLHIIHTGTIQDKQHDLEVYDFIDIDLRGKLSVKELFILTASDNVLHNISFDAFGMHLFLLYNKPSHILFRGRFLKRNQVYILNYLNPPFHLDEKEREKIITYIGTTK
jgi:hypothetical protein